MKTSIYKGPQRTAIRYLEPRKNPSNPAHLQRLGGDTDAVNRLAGGVAQLIEAAEIKSRGRAERSGLLHFREWWELVEVNICVGGKMITGTPILIEEDTLRVIDQNHSYFIPLGKVDYIRTNDGLRSAFKASDSKTV